MRITDLLEIGSAQRTRRGREGQSLVEFTIMLPILLILMSGLIEFGFLLNSYLDVIDAARVF
jgi:Flp pilus assembly protein TadG